MKVLAFDTALRALSVAVWVDDAIRGRRFEARSRGHAEALFPMIDDVCRQAGVGYGEFDRIAVTVGPGTFAGVRIGLAAARGLAAALDIPVVGLSTLEVVAAGTLDRLRDRDTHVTVLFDARRGQVYSQTFDRALRPLNAPCAITPAALARVVPEGQGALVGDGISLMRDVPGVNREDLEILDGPGQPDAATVARLAPLRAALPPGAGRPRPLYLRAPDARLPGNRDLPAG
jgi:tRNA threonylcarbamoyladenosine biosynthesis protein TsaB